MAKAPRCAVRSGMAIVGGLMFSQALTLYTTPVVYLYLDRLRMHWESFPPAVDRRYGQSLSKPRSKALLTPRDTLRVYTSPELWSPTGIPEACSNGSNRGDRERDPPRQPAQIPWRSRRANH